MHTKTPKYTGYGIFILNNDHAKILVIKFWPQIARIYFQLLFVIPNIVVWWLKYFSTLFILTKYKDRWLQKHSILSFAYFCSIPYDGKSYYSNLLYNKFYLRHFSRKKYYREKTIWISVWERDRERERDYIITKMKGTW